MTNPFETADAEFVVLVNAENQHSIWPDFVEVPQGWETVYGPDARQTCLDYIEENWTDMRPQSLIDAQRSS
ncbi:MbtH family protein [Amycolatopsis minnesotensis]|uniref:MbtH family protein n=1 Tax=Amycolatopsis minnesotensis TaxID=337894 RepID=A0ABN2R7X4_9PSEU